MLKTLMMYLGILVIGGIIGYTGRISKKLEGNLDKLQNICLLFLLFVMGITIGINKQVISNLFSIGFKAIIMSLFTVSFSVIFVGLIAKFIVVEEDKIES